MEHRSAAGTRIQGSIVHIFAFDAHQSALDFEQANTPAKQLPAIFGVGSMDQTNVTCVPRIGEDADRYSAPRKVDQPGDALGRRHEKARYQPKLALRIAKRLIQIVAHQMAFGGMAKYLVGIVGEQGYVGPLEREPLRFEVRDEGRIANRLWIRCRWPDRPWRAGRPGAARP